MATTLKGGSTSATIYHPRPYLLLQFLDLRLPLGFAFLQLGGRLSDLTLEFLNICPKDVGLSAEACRAVEDVVGRPTCSGLAIRLGVGGGRRLSIDPEGGPRSDGGCGRAADVKGRGRRAEKGRHKEEAFGHL